jgi:tRNA1Val (adenine37-N6)-methyltransferase
MSESFFKFKQFNVKHSESAMKVGTDSILLGAWCHLSGSERQILDIGSGCGVLSLMMAQRLPLANINAVEIDQQAYAESVENFKQSSWHDRIAVECADIRNVYIDQEFDFIICNPPFFRNLIPYDQARALARHQGHLQTSEILGQVNRLLNDSGSYATIAPADEHERYLQQAKDVGLYPSHLTKVRHTDQLPIRRILLQFRRISNRCVEDILIIGPQGHRNSNYQQLVAPFYR